MILKEVIHMRGFAWKKKTTYSCCKILYSSLVGGEENLKQKVLKTNYCYFNIKNYNSEKVRINKN